MGEEIVEGAASGGDEKSENELLDEWMAPDAVEQIRGFRQAIHQILDEPGDRAAADGELGVAQLSEAGCFFYCGLFGAVRKLLGRYGTTNPMWLKPAASRKNRIRPSATTLTSSFTARIEDLAERLSLRGGQEPGDSVFETGQAARTGVADNAFDTVLTSPPYATQLDYVQGMLPELAVLGADRSFVRELRRVSTGSPTVDGDRAKPWPFSRCNTWRGRATRRGGALTLY